jgi:hypothetical protein
MAKGKASITRGSLYHRLPRWRVLVYSVLGYGGLAAVLAISSSTEPTFMPMIVAPVSAVLAAVGVALIMLDRTTGNWLARAGAGLAYSLLLFCFAWRSWYAILTGTLMWIVISTVGALVALAWALPAISPPISRALWREQTTPQTRVGRSVVRWGLGLGLAGAGIAGASLGSSLSRTRGSRIAYLVMAVGMSGVAVFMAQEYSERVWPDRPWAHDSEARDTRASTRR